MSICPCYVYRLSKILANGWRIKIAISLFLYLHCNWFRNDIIRFRPRMRFLLARGLIHTNGTRTIISQPHEMVLKYSWMRRGQTGSERDSYRTLMLGPKVNIYDPLLLLHTKNFQSYYAFQLQIDYLFQMCKVESISQPRAIIAWRIAERPTPASYTTTQSATRPPRPHCQPPLHFFLRFLEAEVEEIERASSIERLYSLHQLYVLSSLK